jgi:hypothetical protein
MTQLLALIISCCSQLELPRKFRRGELDRWLAKIPSERSRTIARRKSDEFLRVAR